MNNPSRIAARSIGRLSAVLVMAVGLFTTAWCQDPYIATSQNYYAPSLGMRYLCNVLAFDPNTNVDEWTFSWSPADEVSDPTAQSMTIAPKPTVYSVEMLPQMARYIWMKSPSRCIRCLVSSPTPKWPCVQRSEDN